MNRQDFTEKLIKKASNDEIFRKRLISDTKNVIKDEAGLNIPPEINIKVLEEKPDEFYLVLPPKENPNGELSEAELDTVAGGWSGANECTGQGACG